MKVVRLEVEGFKGIVAREVTADGKHVTARGKNGSGKSSLVESLVFALRGDGGTQPVHVGSQEARVTVDVGEFVFTRVAAPGKPTKFTAKNRDGSPVKSPAAFLAKLVGTGLALDPTRLFRLPDAEQVEEILRALKVDVTAETLERDTAYEKRTDVNRRARDLEGGIAELRRQGIGTDIPPVVTTAEALDAVTSAQARATAEERRKGALEAAQAREAAAQKALEDAMAELGAAQEAVATAEAATADPLAGEALVKAKGELQDLDARNKRARLAEDLRGKLTQQKALEAQAAALTEQIDALALAKAKKIDDAAAALGIEGLRFNAEGTGVTYRDVRLVELNGAEWVKLGLRFAFATMPEMRVAVVDQASELDDESLREVLAWGFEKDVQLWLAMVDDKPMLEIELMDAPDAAA